MPCRDLVCLKHLGSVRDQFGQAKALVNVGDAPARFRRNRGNVVSRLRGFEQRLVGHGLLVGVNVFADRILDQLVFENLRVRQLNDPDWNGGKLRQSRSPKAARSGNHFKGVQVEVADDQRNEDTLGSNTLREFE